MGALVGPRLATIATQRMASRRLLANEIGPAQWWLAWAAWFDSGDYRTDLLQASCERQRRRQDRWEESMRQARRKGAPKDRWNLEFRLGRIQSARWKRARKNASANLNCPASRSAM